MTDAAGTRSYTYNEFDELVSESLTADGVTHAITESRDAFGRSSGFDYAKAGSAASSEQYGYGTDGRLSSAAFSHGGEWKTFGYSYLAGSNLLQTLSMPNGMTLTQQYEEKRDLLTAMLYKRGETGVAERYYSYDSLGRPVTRQENRNGGSRSDAFTHNDRSELTAATLGNKSYTYAYDNIGNRKTAQEDAEEATNYDANALNQYTAIGDFAPQFDADGNQTRVQTSTGIWSVTYNAENRPVTFDRANTDGTTTRVTCAYDHMGRRATKKVESISAADAETGESSATTTLHQRYLYRNYLQIACCDLTRTNHPHLWFLAWDPTQPTATRPLALRKDGTWYCYGWDLTKNICELFSNTGTINNTVTYSYTPYGAVLADGTVQQAIQWSSEFYDDELGMVYYNYRHYNSIEGRWIGRDKLAPQDGTLYLYVKNATLCRTDQLGLDWKVISSEVLNHTTPVSSSGNGRGVTRFPGDASDLTYIIQKITKDGNTCYCIQLKGNISIGVHILSSEHELFNIRLGRYDAKWGVPRTNQREREATIAHEYDHRDVFTVGLSNVFAVLNNTYERKYYENEIDAIADAMKAQSIARAAFNEAMEHTRKFDTTNLNQGGMYSLNPFVFPVDALIGNN